MIRNGIKHEANGIVLCIAVHEVETVQNPEPCDYRILGTRVCVPHSTVQKHRHVSVSLVHGTTQVTRVLPLMSSVLLRM